MTSEEDSKKAAAAESRATLIFVCDYFNLFKEGQTTEEIVVFI